GIARLPGFVRPTGFARFIGIFGLSGLEQSALVRDDLDAGDEPTTAVVHQCRRARADAFITGARVKTVVIQLHGALNASGATVDADGTQGDLDALEIQVAPQLLEVLLDLVQAQGSDTQGCDGGKVDADGVGQMSHDSARLVPLCSGCDRIDHLFYFDPAPIGLLADSKDAAARSANGEKRQEQEQDESLPHGKCLLVYC